MPTRFYRLLPVAVFSLIAILLLATLAGCAQREEAAGETEPASLGARLDAIEEPANTGQKLKVVATTSIVGDVVRQIGGEALDLTVLLPVGTDPHGFEPSPQEIARVADADLIFVNGAGLEQVLQPLLDNAGGEAQVDEVSDGIELYEGDHEDEQDEHADEDGENGHEVDPHTWTDPNNVIIWTKNIEASLKEMDPSNAPVYTANADQYRQELVDLDAWVREQVEKIPTDQRELVVDHQVFAYFAEEYGFEQIGAIIPGFSTLAEPSAQEVAKLEDAIRELNVKAIFVGTSVNPSLAERIAADTNTQIVRVYTGSLSEPGGEASSYLDYIRYNVNAIVNALSPQ